MSEYKVEILRYPSERELSWCKECTLNTVGKKSANAPSNEWIERLVKAEHSPIRELWFGIRMEIPYWVSVHFVRHHIGVNHYIQSQRDDRTNNVVSRVEKPQGEIVSHIMSINAQELINMSHKRLCLQASKETREVMKKIVNEIVKVAPYMKDVLVPLCVYRGGLCNEMFPCGKKVS